MNWLVVGVGLQLGDMVTYAIGITRHPTGESNLLWMHQDPRIVVVAKVAGIILALVCLATAQSRRWRKAWFTGVASLSVVGFAGVVTNLMNGVRL